MIGGDDDVDGNDTTFHELNCRRRDRTDSFDLLLPKRNKNGLGRKTNLELVAEGEILVVLIVSIILIIAVLIVTVSRGGSCAGNSRGRWGRLSSDSTSGDGRRWDGRALGKSGDGRVTTNTDNLTGDADDGLANT